MASVESVEALVQAGGELRGERQAGASSSGWRSLWYEGSLLNGGVTLLFLLGSISVSFSEEHQHTRTLLLNVCVCVCVWAVCDVLARNLKH